MLLPMRPKPMIPSCILNNSFITPRGCPSAPLHAFSPAALPARSVSASGFATARPRRSAGLKALSDLRLRVQGVQDGRLQPLQSVGDIRAEVDAQRAAATLGQHLKIAACLRG